jgi:hypothetical protein
MGKQKDLRGFAKRLEGVVLFNVFQVGIDALEPFGELGLEAIIGGRLNARLEFFGLVAAPAAASDLTVTFNSHRLASSRFLLTTKAKLLDLVVSSLVSIKYPGCALLLRAFE